MKTITLSALSILLMACSASTGTTAGAAASAAEPSDAVAAMPQDATTDTVSGATNVATPTVFNGTLILPPQNNNTITLPMGGIVTSFSHLPGASVKRGEVIAVLENMEFVELQQSYLEAAAQSEFLEAEYSRQCALSAENATSGRSLQQSKADFLTMKSRKDAAAARLTMLDVEPSGLITRGITPLLEVRAPQSGYISEVMVNQGKFVAAGEVICHIINKSELYINLIAYEKDLAAIRAGQPLAFRVNGLGEELFEAQVSAIGQQVDPVNRSVKIYARVLSKHPDFRPGMYVIAQIK